MQNYIIVNSQEPALCWSNTLGWTEENYDTFSETDKETMLLPIGGHWEAVPWFIN